MIPLESRIRTGNRSPSDVTTSKRHSLLPDGVGERISDDGDAVGVTLVAAVALTVDGAIDSGAGPAHAVAPTRIATAVVLRHAPVRAIKGY